jgi:type I restriction enzyme S subunit
MSRYKAYAVYKDSGVESLTKIPTHWEHTRVKYIGELTPKKPVIDRKLECSFIPMEKLKTDSITLDETRVVGDVYDGYTYFQDEDILMAKVTPCFENKNIAVAKNLVNGIGFGSSEIYVIRTKKDVCNRYWFYRFQEDSFMDIATAAMSGAGGLKRVPSDVVTNFTAALPSILEQQKIANFLDHETAKIDTLIAKQQGLIKLLKEKRQAVISHAVTKGLNPNAPIRDSGVEWLGEVPTHWVSSPLKHYANIVDCKHITAEFFDEGIPLASIGEVKEWLVNLRTAKLTSERFYFELIGGGRKPVDGDIIYSRNATVGEAALVSKDMPRFAMGQDVCLIRSSGSLFSEYVLHVLKSRVIAKQLDLAMVGSTFKRINVDDIRNFLIAFPPYDEQITIAKELNRIIDKYEGLTANAESAIELMQERRTALISAAVTGKIDVRDWHPLSVPELEDAAA